SREFHRRAATIAHRLLQVRAEITGRGCPDSSVVRPADPVPDNSPRRCAGDIMSVYGGEELRMKRSIQGWAARTATVTVAGLMSLLLVSSPAQAASND